MLQRLVVIDVAGSWINARSNQTFHCLLYIDQFLPSEEPTRTILVSRESRKHNLYLTWKLINVPSIKQYFLCIFVVWRSSFKNLRRAWRDHCFPAPFSWFLHKTGLESMKITSARCFSLKCRRKDSKKVKEHCQFRPWALAYSRDWPYNVSCLSAMSKNGRLRSFFSALGCHFFFNWIYIFFTRNSR